MKSSTKTTIAVLLVAGATIAQDAPPTAPAAPRPPWQVCREVLVQEVSSGITAGAGRRAARTDPDAIRSWQAETRAWLRGVNRPSPAEDRAPPPAVTVRTLTRERFRIEHLLIESRPGMHVTAHLYLPDPDRFAPPVPAVVVACGHSEAGKAEAAYQRGAATLAAHGVAALVFDPLDQGERMQTRTEEGRRTRWGTAAHNVSGAQALLLGWSQAGLEAWDGMRCVDALAARPDIDPDRLGICGNSGGGTQSAQLFALDSRLRVAAPSCYLTGLVDLAQTIGPQDAEQNLLGQAARGFDHADYLTVRAPAPALICAATRDFFPIAGTRRALTAAQQVYRAFDAAGAVALAEVDAGHGWAPELIEATTAWMVRWLDDRQIEARCVETPPMPDAAQARVTPTGQVLDLDGERSVFDVLAEAAEAPQRSRERLSPRQRIERARALCRVRTADRLPHASWQADEAEAGTWVPFRVQLDDGMQLAASRRRGRSPSDAGPSLILGAGAWSRERARLDPADRDVFWLDPLAVGEGAPDEQTWYGAFGAAGRDAAFCLLLDRPLVGRQTEQILAVARQLSADAGAPVELVARGPVALAALHAAAFEPELFTAIDVEPPIRSWGELLGPGAAQALLAFAVPGALAAYDIEDLLDARRRRR